MTTRLWTIPVVAALVAFGAACIPRHLPPPTDFATVSKFNVPREVRRLQPFTVTAYANDPGSNNYMVTFVYSTDANGDGPLTLVQEQCNGTRPDNPSPDTPACEYDSNTTTLNTVTRTVGVFTWSGPVGSTYTLKVCAASFDTPPVPFPDGGSCLTRTFTTVA